MASIILKDIPADLHAQLKREADAGFRSLDQEILAIQRSFDLDKQLNAMTVNQLIQEAVESGPEEPLTRHGFDTARRKARESSATKHRAA